MAKFNTVKYDVKTKQEIALHYFWRIVLPLETFAWQPPPKSKKTIVNIEAANAGLHKFASMLL